MKKLPVIITAFAVFTSVLRAQTLNVTAPGYSGAKLFDATPGYWITSMGADASGAVYYAETDSAFTASTKVYKRTSADGYTSAATLYNYGFAAFGSFITIQSGKVYFGDGTTIRSMNLDGSSPALIGSVTGSYDLAFSGGSAFVSANPDTTFANPQNRVLALNLSTGATQEVLNATPDYSGPIEFDASGNLIYGVAKSAIGGIYQYTAAQVATGLTTPIVLTPPTGRVIANGGNQYLAYAGGTTVWQDDFSTLRSYDLGTATGTTVASSTDTLGNLDFAGGVLYAGVTNFTTNNSAVFAVVPEPSSAFLLAFGMLVLARRRK
jgi:hypothetical protein